MSKYLFAALRLLSHNENHFLDVRIGRQRLKLCTRCTGMLLGFFISLPSILLFNVYRAPGNMVAAISVMLFLPDFIYWALTRVRMLPDRNEIRFVNGFLLGISIAAYGQADLAWTIKAVIPGLLFLIVILGDPIIGRTLSKGDR
jgi:uncharacterized membrane protein